ncbi:N-acetylmuramidase domain-containing protein [Halomonas sp. HK25]|uniref:N-acetylmuramidase domain-containing protein n=1 Tax=Halomonas sp. HK25 TaxID=3394321 RepID=UPI0039FD7DD1
MLRYGTTGPAVERLQRDLNRHRHDLEPDGVFGPATEAAVRTFQRKSDLVIDGLAGPKTQRALQLGRDPKALRQIDLVGAANTLEVELAAIMAINEVESRGAGFHHGGQADGEPVTLFERHIMRRRLIHYGINPEPYQRNRPNLVNVSPGGYVGGAREYLRLSAACEIHGESALESASWGLFQIMGFHWRGLGYASVGHFAEAMRASEGRQLEAFVRFIEGDRALHAALARLDWRDFARRYNGPDFERNDYDTKLAAAYRRHSHALEQAA